MTKNRDRVRIKMPNWSNTSVAIVMGCYLLWFLPFAE